MRHLIESASKLTEATQEQLNQMRQYIQTLTTALEMYPDMASEIEPRLARLRAFVQNDSNQRQQGDPNDPRTNPGQPNTVPEIPNRPDNADGADAPQQPRVADEKGMQQGGDIVNFNIPQFKAYGTYIDIPDRNNPGFVTRVYGERANLQAFIQSDPRGRGLRIKSTGTTQAPGQPNTVPNIPQPIAPSGGPNTRGGPRGGGSGSTPSVDARAGTMIAESKNLNEASININGADASEVAEILRMMQLAGAGGAKVLDVDDINPGPKPCPICGKVHGPMPKPGGCGMSEPEEPGMGDMIRMVSKEEEDYDGDFQDATTEPDEDYTDDLNMITPSGDDLHRTKDMRAVRTTDPSMAVESLKKELAASLAEKMKSKDEEVSEDDDDPCWDDYEMIGMKKKNGKEVPNCVPKK